MEDIILELQNVKTYFPIQKGFIFKRLVGSVKAVDGVSFTLKRGEVLGLVGESGCGKSTLARTILQLLPTTEGRILFNGKDLTASSRKEMTKIRCDMQMIFQDPFASLNPRRTVFETLAEPLRVHKLCELSAIPQRVAALLETVGLSSRFIHKYPHEFSGGQRQRIAIARALALEPKLIIADEPVSALDVSIQAQILNLLAELTRKMGLSLVFIAHDLSVVKHISDRIAVMYLGKVVELGTALEIIDTPKHPYTRALVSAIPRPDPDSEKNRHRIMLPGDPPSPLDPPPGCTFHTRCPHVKDSCKLSVPTLSVYQKRFIACSRINEI